MDYQQYLRCYLRTDAARWLWVGLNSRPRVRQNGRPPFLLSQDPTFRVCCLLFSFTASPGFGVCIKIARCFAQRFAGLARLESKRCFGCQFGQAVGRSAPELVAFKDADAVENYAWGPSCQPLRSYWADFLFVWDGGGTWKILEVIKKITPISLAGCWWLVIGCWACVLCQYWRWCCWSWMLSWHHSRQPRWGRRNTVNQVIRGCAVFLSCNSLGIATSSVVWSREETCFYRNKVSHSIPKFTAERNYH